MQCYFSIITIYWITLSPAPATVTPAITGWIGSMQCNVATTRCQDRLTKFFCIFFSAWLCRGTSEPRGTWPDRAVPHHLCVSSLKYVGANQAERTQSSANGGDKQNAWWLGGTDLHNEVRYHIIHNCWYKSDYDTKSVNPQLSREAGFGCPGLLGHLHLGGRVSETRLFFL